MASMKLVLLFAIVATICSLSCGFVDRKVGGRGGGGRPGNFPGTPPFNPGRHQGLPPAYHGRFRREAVMPIEEEAAVYDAPQYEYVRYARDVPIRIGEYYKGPKLAKN